MLKFEYVRDIVGDELEDSELTPKRVLIVMLVGALVGVVLSSVACKQAS